MRGRELERYLQLLAGTDPGERLLEIRYRHGDGMRQRFTPARDFGQAAGVIRSLGRLTDVYVGVLLRDRRSGGRDAVSRSHLVFAELDAPFARDVPTHLAATAERDHRLGQPRPRARVLAAARSDRSR